METPHATPKNSRQNMRALLWGGLIPLVAYTVVEIYFGTFWGLIAGLALGFFEIAYERFSQGKVETITWIGNGLLFFMGGISLITESGLWFKLQPAILEAATGLFIFGSLFFKKNFLELMSEKQGLFEKFPPPFHPTLRTAFRGLCFRLSIFFLLHAGLATYAALYWSTAAWATLKGVGFTASLVVYFLGEMVWLRRRIRMGSH